MANGLTRSFSKDKRTSQSKKIYELNDSVNNGDDGNDGDNDKDVDDGDNNVNGKPNDDKESLHKVNDPFDIGQKSEMKSFFFRVWMWMS